MSSKQRQPYNVKLINELAKLQKELFKTNVWKRMHIRNKIKDLMEKLDNYNLKGIKRDKKNIKQLEDNHSLKLNKLFIDNPHNIRIRNGVNAHEYRIFTSGINIESIINENRKKIIWILKDSFQKLRQFTLTGRVKCIFHSAVHNITRTAYLGMGYRYNILSLVNAEDFDVMRLVDQFNATIENYNGEVSDLVLVDIRKIILNTIHYQQRGGN